MKLLLATTNKHKVVELQNALSNIEVISLSSLNDFTEVEEGLDSLEKNAYLKAKYFYDKYNIPVIADDTGLFVEALNGAPGVKSARYSDSHTPKDNNLKLLSEMKDKTNRRAYFKCVICYISQEGKVSYFEGIVNGEILTKQTIFEGFGYDPLFYVPEIKKTFAEITTEEKNKISHRGLAVEKLVAYLNNELLEIKIVNYLKMHNYSNIKVIKRLLGGMSNYTYLISINNDLYTFRIPGENSEVFVDNEIEKENLKLMETLNITNQTIHLNPQNGYKLSKYVEGVALNEVSEYPYHEIADELKKIHKSTLRANNDYRPFERLAKYENILITDYQFDTKDANCYQDYLKCKAELLSYYDFLNSQELVLCHGDSQPSNFIKGDKIYIVDFEFAGNNDLVYDIACFANLRLEDGEKLMEAYFEKPTYDEWKRFYLWRAFQCLQWFNVAWFKEFVGLSKKLHFDFALVAKNYLNLASNLLQKVKTL